MLLLGYSQPTQVRICGALIELHQVTTDVISIEHRGS